MGPLYIHPRLPQSPTSVDTFFPQSPPASPTQRTSERSASKARVFAVGAARRAELTGPSPFSRAGSPDPEEGLLFCTQRGDHLEDINRALQYQMRAKTRKTPGKAVLSSSCFDASNARPDLRSKSSKLSSNGVYTPHTRRTPSTSTLDFPVKPDPRVPVTFQHFADEGSLIMNSSCSHTTRSVHASSAFPNASETAAIHSYKRMDRPARSQSSLLLRSLDRIPSTPHRVSQPENTYPNSPATPSIGKLPPLARFNPFGRTRAESMSSVISATSESDNKQAKNFSPEIKRTRRQSTLTNLWSKGKRQGLF